MLDIIADIMQNSTLSESAVEKERSVILQEAQEVNKIPEEVVLDHLHATAFQKSPLGQTILGPMSNIKAITRQHIVDYIQTHYTAPRMVLVGAGNVEHGDLVKMAERSFQGLPSGGVATADLLAQQPPYFTGSDVRIREPHMDTCNFAIAFEGLPHTHPDLPALMILQKMIGEFNEASTTDHFKGSTLASSLSFAGTAKSMFAFSTPYHDTGLFGIYCSANEDKIYNACVSVSRRRDRPSPHACEGDEGGHSNLRHATAACVTVAPLVLAGDACLHGAHLPGVGEDAGQRHPRAQPAQGGHPVVSELHVLGGHGDWVAAADTGAPHAQGGDHGQAW